MTPLPTSTRVVIMRMLFVFFLSFNLYAQECDFSRPLSTPSDNFFINDDGTVTDVDSGLSWMRCAIGQQWNGKTCTGAAIKYSWKQAFKQEDKIKQNGGYAGLHNWRLPTLAELAMIVERQCHSPRVNLMLFPATPSDVFWSSNHKKSKIPQAFAMDFAKKGLQPLPQEHIAYVRLVSGRE